MNTASLYSPARLARAVLAWGGTAALIVLLVLSTQAVAQRFRTDPIEGLRKVLRDREAYDPKPRISLFDKKEEKEAAEKQIETALKTYRTALEKGTGPEALRTPAEMTQALLLTEWVDMGRKPTPPDPEDRSFKSQVPTIEFAVRKKLAARLVKSTETELASGGGERQRALAELMSETMPEIFNSIEDLPLYDDLARALSKPLANLANNKRASVQARAAAARTLARCYHKAGGTPDKDIVGDGLRGALTPTNPEPVRRAAATGMEELVRFASGTEPMRGSEPGVSLREARGNNKRVPRGARLDMAARVARVAAAGKDDPSPAVRGLCTQAIRQSAELLRTEVNEPIAPLIARLPLPEIPGEHRATIELPITQITPLINALVGDREALRKAVFDSDPKSRLEARFALNALARTRGMLHTARNAKYDIDDPSAPGKKADRQKAFKDAEAALERALSELVEQITTSGFSDPIAASRRAAAEAAEGLEGLAEPAIPRLVKMLKDKDPFVRWVVARTLGKLGKRADDVVPSLLANIDDEDLDARMAAIEAVGKFGPEANRAVEALARTVGKGDAEVRVATIKALEDIGKGSAPALPAVVREFANIDPRVRAAAIRLVGRFEAKARPYIADLRKMLGDLDIDVRKAASAAILAIPDPDRKPK
jgi:HEAT repeat protein